MGKIIDQWDGQVEDAKIEYNYEYQNVVSDIKSDVHVTTDSPDVDYDKADKADYIVAASCGVLTGLLDSFWVGKFSLSTAQEWGRSKANSFVIKIAQMRGYGKSELDGAIRFLEKDAPIPSDQLTRTWGGGLQHHFRDFAHHASVVGLVFSVMSQFTGLSYGTNTEGRFEMHELPSKDLIGKTFEEKLFNGTVIWALHLVSDMAGSSNCAGKGTGIPGPILSLAKELSVLPKIRDLKVEYKGAEINLSVMLSKIFNGTAFLHSGHDDVVRFDLRTEMGVYAFGVAQSIPVVINQCMVRAFYFVKRLYIEISRKQIKGIRDIAKLEPEHFLPWNNKCIVRMLTISSGVFCSVDASDAAIRSFIRSPQNKSEFFSQFLLRMNFVGIGNFVVSIKNDIAANIFSDIKGLSYIDKRTNSDNNSIPENIAIDIAVEIDNTGIYDYAFYRMYDYVKKAKDNFTAGYKVSTEMEREILCLEDDETGLFNCVASKSQHALIVETEDLMMRLFTLYGVDYVAFAGDSKYRYYMPFYRNESRGRIGYIFSRSLMERIKWESIKDEYDIDGINVVALVEPGENSESRNAIMGEEIRKSQGFVQYMPLKDLFALISDDEYDVYMSYVNKFNKDIHKLIGYRTIVVPSDSSLKTLKADIENELRATDFDSLLTHEGVYSSQLQVIRDNFWERGLYQALLSGCSFAESFISSEWYYKTHVDFSVLEQTAIIAGYLKSVEQLLYAIVQLSEGTGKQIKKKGGERVLYIDFTAENEPFIDSTLGSIIGYVRHYSDLWDVNAFVKNFVVNKLNVYREKYRNDHFHKDNVNSIEEIKEIRNNTILLHYLLLGAMRIKDADKEKLGIVNISEIAEEKEDISYEIFEKWLNRIIGGDVLLPKISKIYFQIVGWGTDKWKLEFSTVSGFKDQRFPENMKWPYICDDLKWDRILEEEETEKKVVSFIKKYLNNGKYAGNLKAYAMIYAGLFGHPQILYRR